MTPEEEIKENARGVIEGCAPLSGLGSRFGYNRESVEWLDGYIERLRDSGKFNEEEQIKGLTINFGSFLGECIRSAYGGEWREHNSTWGVFFKDSSAAFPFSKVRKQLEDGPFDSFLSFYDVLPRILSGELEKQAEPGPPKWKATLKRWFGR
jgi:hypothetical protein